MSQGDPTHFPILPLVGIKITDGGNTTVPGHAFWLLRGNPVWAGRLDQPVEDVVFDEMVMNATDIAKLQEAVDAQP